MSILGKSVIELLTLLKKKKISSKELYSYFVNRIKRYNPKINAFLTVNQSLEKAFDKKNWEKIPIAVKDNFCTQGLRTTASSKVLDNFIPPYESTVTQRLLNNGFLIIGKTNMDAWAHGSSTETSDYGATKNPWNLTRVPGGSSGGSAAAVSSYLSPAAIGSETAGSIRGPASWTGVVGLKPTYGRVSRYGLIAMGSSLDCPGLLTLTVEDAAYLLGIIAGKDPYDATSSFEPVPNYLDRLKKKKRLVIGIPDLYFKEVDQQVADKVFHAIEILKTMGHRIKKIKLLNPKYAISVYTVIQRAEVSSNLSRYDGIRYGNNRSFFAQEAKKRIMLGSYTLSYGYYDAYYKKAQKVRTIIIEDFKRVFKEVNVIVGPTMPTTALKLGEFKRYPFFGERMDVLNEPSAVSGLPAVSIPVGLDRNNLPVGMQIIGHRYDEETVLNLAYQFEKETGFFGVIKRGMGGYRD